MLSPSMSTNLQRHVVQPPRPPFSAAPNNGIPANIATTRNVMPLQMQQQQQQQGQVQSSQHHVRFNQDLLNNYGINLPMARQSSQPGTNEIPPPSPTSVTSLIPLPSPLPNNLGVNMHHINQASITPTILGGFPMHQSSPQQGGNPNAFVSPQQTNAPNKLDAHHTISPHGPHHPLSSPGHHAPPGIYVTTRPMHPSPVTTVTGITNKVKQQQQQQQQQQHQHQHQQVLRPNMPTNGTPSGPSAVVLRYPSQIQAGQQQQPSPQQQQQQQQQQQHQYQMMKPRMMASNAFGQRGPPPPHPHQLIMQPTAMQQTQMMYDPNNHYRATAQQQQPPLPQQQQQQQQPQQITQLQANSHMNDGLMNQQKHPHQQAMLQLPPGMLTTDDNILKSLLKVNPQAVSSSFLPSSRRDWSLFLPCRTPKTSLPRHWKLEVEIACRTAFLLTAMISMKILKWTFMIIPHMSIRMATITIRIITSNSSSSICTIQVSILKHIPVSLYRQLPTWRYQSHGRNVNPLKWATHSKKTSQPKRANAKVSRTARESVVTASCFF